MSKIVILVLLSASAAFAIPYPNDDNDLIELRKEVSEAIPDPSIVKPAIVEPVKVMADVEKSDSADSALDAPAVVVDGNKDDEIVKTAEQRFFGRGFGFPGFGGFGRGIGGYGFPGFGGGYGRGFGGYGRGFGGYGRGYGGYGRGFGGYGFPGFGGYGYY